VESRREPRAGRPINRRDFLRVGGVLGAASVAAACGATATEQVQVSTPALPPGATQVVSGTATLTWPPPGAVTPQAAAKPTPACVQHQGELALRVGHISDMHIKPDGPGVEGFRRALRDLQARDPKVDIVLNTGDCVMDSLEADKASTQAQWNAFKEVVQTECSLPIYHAIGNHDVWGWGLPDSTQRGLRSDPLFAKGFAMQELGIPDRFYSFDAGGWRFLVLDSVHERELAKGLPYTGKLDEEQFAWLGQQLDATPMSVPVCVVSHIPILCACEFLDGDNETSGNWIVPGAWMHIDARRLWSLFWQHPNVKLGLSGHTHQVEGLEYHRMKYLTDGAISANWWNGAYMDVPPGYVVVNLYKDGSSSSEFVAY
jgi:Icc protein